METLLTDRGTRIALTAAVAVLAIGSLAPANTVIVERTIGACDIPNDPTNVFKTTPAYDETMAGVASLPFATTAEQYRSIMVSYNKIVDKRLSTDYPSRGQEATPAVQVQAHADYTTEVRQVPVNTLKEMDITVDADKAPSSDLQFLFDLTTLPKRVLEAAGLDKVVVQPEDKTRDQYYEYIPEHHGSTMVIDQGAQYALDDGVAAMVFDNFCTPAQQQAIIDDFQSITTDAGKQYSPRKPAASSKVFSYEGYRSPRDEFIGLLAWAIRDGDTVDAKKLHDPLTQKEAITETLAEQIEPRLHYLGAFNNVYLNWGTHGLHPHDQVTRAIKLNKVYAAAKTAAEQKQISEESTYGPMGDDWPYDYDAGLLSVVLKKRYVEPKPSNAEPFISKQ